MQDRYTGDIGDYVKYGLLRALGEGRRLGVAWYRFPDEDHNSDGRHVAYLKNPRQWRHHDAALFDELDRIVDSGQRKVAAIEKSGILGPTKFSGAILSASELTVPQRRVWRCQWFESVQTSMQDCDVVFADPDNGLCKDEKFGAANQKSWKRLPLHEARMLAKGRTAILYHHNTRYPGGHAEEIKHWQDQLGTRTLAVRWRAYSARTFFVVNPAAGMLERLIRFSEEWGPKAAFHPARGPSR